MVQWLECICKCFGASGFKFDPKPWVGVRQILQIPVPCRQSFNDRKKYFEQEFNIYKSLIRPLMKYVRFLIYLLLTKKTLGTETVSIVSWLSF